MERSLEARPVTVEEFCELPEDDLHHELVEGWATSEPMPGARHGWITVRLAAALDAVVRAENLGLVVCHTGFILARNPDTVRGPDVAFIKRQRVAEVDSLVTLFPGAPDLAVEILSPTNRPGEMRAKVADYLAAGTRLVWVVDPEAQKIRVYRSLLAPRVLGAEDTLDGEDIVPGFRLRLSELFEL